jgi:hypothetical protein
MTPSCAFFQCCTIACLMIDSLRQGNLRPRHGCRLNMSTTFALLQPDCPRSCAFGICASKCQAQTKNGEQCVCTIRLRSALFHYTGSGEGVLPGRTIPKEESASRGAFSHRFLYRIVLTVSLLYMRTALCAIESCDLHGSNLNLRLGSTRIRWVDFHRWSCTRLIRRPPTAQFKSSHICMLRRRSNAMLRCDFTSLLSEYESTTPSARRGSRKPEPPHVYEYQNPASTAPTPRRV